MKKYIVVLLFCCTLATLLSAQTTNTLPIQKKPKDLIYRLNEDGSQYVKLTFLNQICACAGMTIKVQLTRMLNP
ncbi:hypothetical protein [Cesiribacter sp. SM1]|uniref:hypothetical protein n=1 Tax=Cesiribacter sp. SM1 TaxID=2861196 RepID=UPI001CD222AC|nr:hypothetical protein [Cesiribacter sp. SM1]